MRFNLSHFAAILSMVFLSSLIQAQAPEGFTWQDVKSVDFGEGANHFTIKAASTGLGGELELHLDAPDGPLIGRAYFHHTGHSFLYPDSSVNYMDYECTLTQTLSGIHDVYMNFLDYSEPVLGGVLNVGDFKYDLIETPIVTSEERLHVYPPVPGLDPSPYYEIRLQKVSELNSANLADVTNWESPFAWFTRCKEGGRGYYDDYIGGWSHTYTNFELDPNTPIVVKISRKDDIVDGAPSGPITSAAVRPAHKVDSWEIIGGEVYVTMSQPAQVAIDIDGQMDTRKSPRALPTGWGSSSFPYSNLKNGAHSVTIFANPFISDKPDPDDPGVLVLKAGEKIPDKLDELDWDILYFEPGVHKTSVDVNEQGELVDRRWEPEDQITLEDNKTYYIPGDAIVYGNFTDFNSPNNTSENIRVYGHGTISGTQILHYRSWDDYPDSEYPNGEWHRAMLVRNAKNCSFEGITMVDPANHTITIEANSHEVYEPNSIKWAKIIAWRPNSDGTAVGGNTYVEDCFFRTQDDGHYIGGAKPLRRCIFWHDVNGQTFRGDFTTDRIGQDYAPNMPKQIIVEDIDIIYARGVFVTSDNSFGIIGVEGGWNNKIFADGVENTGQMVLFRNIRITDPLPTRSLFSFKAGDKNGDYAGMRFENIDYLGKQIFDWRDWLEGGPKADIRNFVFDNVSINGKEVDADIVNDPALFKTDRAYNFTFRLYDTIPSGEYVLTRTATNGSIKLDTNAVSSELTLIAVPNPGYEFTGWSGDLSGTDSIATLLMDEDKGITAGFSLISYTINARSENGTIVLDPAQPWYLPGSEVSISAVGDLGFAFSSWGGDLSGSENPIVVTMDQDLNIAASYDSVATYKISASVDHGSILLDPPGGEYSEGREVKLTYRKDFGYTLKAWSGDLSGSENPQVIIMDADKDIMAHTDFTGDAITSYAINCGGGAYEASDGTLFTSDMNFSGGNTYSTGSAISGTEDPSLYRTERYGNLVYSFDLTNGEYIVTLMFAEIYASDPGARLFNVLIDGEALIDSLDLILEAGKNTAYDVSFSMFVMDGGLDIELETLRDNAKISAIKIMPVFEGTAYSLSTNSTNGSILTKPAGTLFIENTSVAVEAIPDEGYAFQGWSGDLTGKGNPDTLVMTSDMNIAALFSVSTGMNDPVSNGSDKGILFQNYPNPFTSTTMIPYELSAASHVRLTVYNILGETISVLVDAYQSAGRYTVEWSGTDNHDKVLKNGLYIYQMEVDNHSVLYRKAVITE